MKFALVTRGLPQPSTNGGAMTCWAITQALKEAGHDVSVIAFSYHNFDSAERRAELTDMGVDLILMTEDEGRGPQDTGHEFRPRFSYRGPLNGPSGAMGKLVGGASGSLLHKLRWLLPPDPAAVFPTTRLGPQIESALERVRPDATFAYHWDSLAGIRGSNLASCMAGVGDLWQLPGFYKWRASRPALSREYLRRTLATFRLLYFCPRLMVNMLKQCHTKGAFAAHYARWLRDRGVTDCKYLRTPLEDRAGPEWRRLREERSTGGTPRILLGPSNLNATSTRAGIVLFVKETLPILESRLGKNGFEVHVLGEGQPPPELARLLPRPSVRLRGRVEPADLEFLSADIHLVPTPIELGIRVRVISGFSFGCCVIAHKANLKGIPELVHEENILLAPDGKGLAHAIIRAVESPELREMLGSSARRTYERYFAPPKAATAIVAELERIAERQPFSLGAE